MKRTSEGTVKHSEAGYREKPLVTSRPPRVEEGSCDLSWVGEGPPDRGCGLWVEGPVTREKLGAEVLAVVSH